MRREGEYFDRKPFLALSVGYFVDFFLPFRMGELIKALVYKSQSNQRLEAIISSIIFERITDLLFVAAACLLIFHAYFWVVGLFLLGVYLTCCSLLIMTRCSVVFRHLISSTFSIFNSSIRVLALDIIWRAAIFHGENRGGFAPWYIAISIAMWATYAVSLVLFAKAVGFDHIKVFELIYVSRLSDAMPIIAKLPIDASIPFTIYILSPLAMLMIVLLLTKFTWFAPVKPMLKSVEATVFKSANHSPSSRLSYSDGREYTKWVLELFSKTKSDNALYAQEALKNTSTIKIFVGGSGATTALIKEAAGLKVRKYSAPSDGDKLKEQHQWLVANSNKLPVINVHAMCSSRHIAYYDMEYLSGYQTFSTAIHQNTIKTSMDIFDEILTTIKNYHHQTAGSVASANQVMSYVEARCVSNFVLAKSRVENLVGTMPSHINNEAVDPSIFAFISDGQKLAALLNNRNQSEIHGDLTLENVMVKSEFHTSNCWKLIDPNPLANLARPFLTTLNYCSRSTLDTSSRIQILILI